MNFKEVSWNKKSYQEFLNYLQSIGDLKYKEFNQKLIFTKWEMLGIKIPVLRKMANSIFRGDYQKFLEVCSAEYFEVVMIQGLVIAKIKDINELMIYFDDYISLIDNWALTDTFGSSLKIVSDNKEEFLKIIDTLIKTKVEYKVRMGLILLLDYYIEEEYLDIIFKYLEEIKSDLYYVNMAMAWLLCEVFINYPDKTLKYLDNNNLNPFTINKTISKIRDSYRVSKEMKDYLLKYKVKKKS